MATNYTFAEAVKILNEGTNLEAIVDIGRRFPLLSFKVSKLVSVCGDDFADLMSYMPAHLTANKVNSAMKAGISSDDNETDDDEPSDASDAKSAKKNGVETGSSENDDEMPDYKSMTGKVLWEILGKAGARKTAKSTKRADLVVACEELWKKQHGEDAGSDEDDDAEIGDSDSDDKYAGKSAMELYKECKKRSLKVAPKKPAKFYSDALLADDAEQEKAANDSDDDWGDDDDAAAEDSKPSKKAEKKSAKAAKKQAKSTDDSDDDGDDWDI